MNGLLWRRDPRWRVLLATILTVALGGALVFWLPRDWASAPPAPPADPHATLVARHFQQGITMLHARQYEHAVTAFHQVLSYAPEIPEAHVNMGFALIGLGKWSSRRQSVHRFGWSRTLSASQRPSLTPAPDRFERS